VREAEEHAAEDKKRREGAETRNQAETLAYSIDKLIKDNEDKLPEVVKTEVQADVDELKSAIAGDDDDKVKAAFEKLSVSQTKLGEAIYAQSQAAAEPAADEQPAPDADAASSDEDVIDAEVVEDDENK
ncbi:MAG: Hsp70 family protein, partial [Microbacterium sp.]